MSLRLYKKEGEDFEKNGFMLPLADERKSERTVRWTIDHGGRYIRQSAKPNGQSKDDNERAVYRDSALAQLSREYSKDIWKGLDCKTVTYYSGWKNSVCMDTKIQRHPPLFSSPETDLFFLDSSVGKTWQLHLSALWSRLHFLESLDENGNPLNTSDHYFKFNIEGAWRRRTRICSGKSGQ